MNPFEQYAAQAGWRLCAIDRGTKGPTYPGWNTRPIPQDALAGLDGAGVLHALSGTCALDVDDLLLAEGWLAERGIDLAALLEAPDAVRIESGREGHCKLLYALATPLRTVQPKESGIELRCATANGKSVQDVLPPTIHPVTQKPYRWAYGDELVAHWSTLAVIPPALHALWKSLAAPVGNAAAIETRPIVQPPKGSGSAIIKKLRDLLSRKSPDVSYDEWIETGMRIHHETGGAQEGFDLWCEWDRPVKRVAYPGDAVLKMHWLSFGSTPGKRVVTIGGLQREDVATADEFEVVTEADSQAAAETAKKEKADAQNKKQEAIAVLESRLIYVRRLDRYLDAERRDILATDHAIQHRFQYLMPRSRGARVDPVKILRESTKRVVVDEIAFHPGEGVTFSERGSVYANTYRPIPVTPEPPTRRELDYIRWLFAKIHDDSYREWLLKFLAHVIQKPGVKIRSIPLIWSEEQGTGKSTMLGTVPAELVGIEYYHEANYEALEEQFNGYLRDKWVVTLSEFKAGTRRERIEVAAKLRPWITDPFVSIREMRTDGYKIRNRLVLTATSNYADAAPIDENDRRWGVYELPTDPITADEIEEIIVGYFNGPRARPTLTYYFREMSLAGFNPNMRPPDTASKREMIEAALPEHLEVLSEALEQQHGPFANECIQASDVQEYLRRRRAKFVPSLHWVGRWLRKHGAERRDVKDSARRNFRIWIIRNHEHWRKIVPEEIIGYTLGNSVDDLTK
ncbi:MAG: bifunctional DNA primase/polymerase [Patescibacteria group bacterium]|nr:bifunctional DNA primase/polymerase [Patescibacteria group bacterium]